MKTRDTGEVQARWAINRPADGYPVLETVEGAAQLRGALDFYLI